MLERLGGPVEREDKSYGLLVLKTPKLDSASGLMDVAEAFSKRVLGCGRNDPLTIAWHIAGYHGSKRSRASGGDGPVADERAGR